MAYTYDDFLKELNRTGAKLSEADMETAKKHPEFGISLISLGEDFNKATTEEQRTLAHNAAEELRKSYGGYYGGMDGSGYIKVPEEQKTGGVQTTDYTNRYAEQQKQLLDELMNREEFSYDKENDPNWSSYKKSYLREGERASANALAQASAASGGRPSTYAMTAAGQAGDYYASKLNDVIPALEQQAYDRYADEGNRILHKLESVNAQEQMDYAKHLNEANRADTFYARELAELERGRQEDEQKRKFAQGQVDAILAAGGTPSEQLVADSGYSTEYVSALETAMAAQKAAEEAAAAQKGKSKEQATKPTLTAAQALSALENGIINDTTLAAYEYYYGQPYTVGGQEEPAEGSVDLSDIQPGLMSDIRSRLMELGAFATDKTVRAQELLKILNSMASSGLINGDQAERIAAFYGF